MQRPFQMIDVFSETAFLGNPVAVILNGEGLSGEQMLAITRWMNLSETTFLLPPTRPEADYRVRIFTLERELPFAGHPTLGSCQAWLNNGGKPKSPDVIVQECEAGAIPLRRVNGRLAFAAPPLLREGPVDDEKLAEVCTFLNIDREDVVDAQWIDNGPGWLGIMMKSAQAVLDVRPAASHPQRLDVGIVGPYETGAETDYELRALFSDQHGGIREDPVTGSLNASVAQWLLGSGRASGGYTASQGQCLGRAGRIDVRQDDDGNTWIAGSTLNLVSGHIEA